MTVAQAVERGAEKLAQGKGGPPDADALLHGLFGRIRFDLGEYEAALVSLEAALQGFASLPNKDDALHVAEWQALGDLGLARLHQLGTLEDEGAEEVIVASIASARLAYEKAQTLKATDPKRALDLSNPLVEIYCTTEQWQEAEDLTREMMSWVERLEGATSIPVAEALGRRALILKTQERDLDGAQELYSRALEMYLELEGPVHPQVANLHNQLGLVALGLGDTVSALTSHQEALRVRRLLFPHGQLDVRKSHVHLADLFRAEGDLQQALWHLEQAIELSETKYGETGGWTVSDTLRLAQILVEDGRLARAEALLQTQLSPQRREARKEGSGLIVQADGILGVVWLAQGKDGGEQLLLRSLEDLRRRPSGYEDAVAWLEDYVPKDSSAV